jgi:hypothetical protein
MVNCKRYLRRKKQTPNQKKDEKTYYKKSCLKSTKHGKDVMIPTEPIKNRERGNCVLVALFTVTSQEEKVRGLGVGVTRHGLTKRFLNQTKKNGITV